MFSCLTALHNLKGRDIRSKVPLSREVVEKLQKEHGRDEDQSRGTYVSRGQGKHRGAQSFRSGYSSRRTTIAEASSELGDFLLDDLTQKRRSQYRSKINPGMQSVHRGRRLSSVSYNLGGQSSRRTSVTDDFSDFGDFGQDAVSPRKQAPYLPSLLSRGRGTHASTLQVERDHGTYNTGARLSIFNTAYRLNTVDTATKNVFGRSKSRNVATISSERPPLETWEDLLNYQPEPYVEKEGKSGGMVFQIGVITKFMRWYRFVCYIYFFPNLSSPAFKLALCHLIDSLALRQTLWFLINQWLSDLIG
ncbi:uncharacterized protein LOC123540296 [Mercenaria mercenaria]|uniref:uncharacterized protein LOC123540296 n=1 Tax=Mercenaria mercenaria TaxID=6596 RepID=UPI00234EEB80|nr:uncharacterized protein LOC123540296 [Mercenaria mercenaria]